MHKGVLIGAGCEESLRESRAPPPPALYLGVHALAVLSNTAHLLRALGWREELSCALGHPPSVAQMSCLRVGIEQGTCSSLRSAVGPGHACLEPGEPIRVGRVFVPLERPGPSSLAASLPGPLLPTPWGPSGKGKRAL